MRYWWWIVWPLLSALCLYYEINMGGLVSTISMSAIGIGLLAEAVEAQKRLAEKNWKMLLDEREKWQGEREQLKEEVQIERSMNDWDRKDQNRRDSDFEQRIRSLEKKLREAE